MPSLFNIQSEYYRALQELDDYFANNPDSDEMPEEIYERLNVNREEMGEKLYNYNLYIKELNGHLESLKSFIKELSAKVKSKERTIESVKSYIGDALKVYGEPVIKNHKPTGSLRFKNERVSVVRQLSKPLEVYDEAAVPVEYKTFDVQFKHLNAEQITILKEIIEKHLPEKGAEIYAEIMLHGRFNTEGNVLNTLVRNVLMNSQDSEEPIEIPGARLNMEASFVKFF